MAAATASQTSAESDRNRPCQRQQEADIGGDALAALEAEPDREEVTEEGAERGRDREVVGEVAILGSIVIIDGEHGEGALERIAHERRRRKSLAAGAQDIGCADIAGSRWSGCRACRRAA